MWFPLSFLLWILSLLTITLIISKIVTGEDTIRTFRVFPLTVFRITVIPITLWEFPKTITQYKLRKRLYSILTLSIPFWLSTTIPYLITKMISYTTQLTELTMWFLMCQTTLITFLMRVPWHIPTVSKKVMTKMTNMITTLMIIFMLTNILRL